MLVWGEEEQTQGERRNRYYISFFLDDEQIFVSDSVYVWSGTRTRPYLAKVMRLWEEKTGQKKVRLRWFFRPDEIEADAKRDPRELFIAAGKGMAGVEDINPLGVIAGKCKVVCTSTHPLNRAPSPEELRDAEYYFDSVYNAETQTVSSDFKEVLDECKATKVFSRICSDSLKVTEVSLQNQNLQASGEKRKTRSWEEELEQIKNKRLMICLENLEHSNTVQELQDSFSVLFPELRFQVSVSHKFLGTTDGLSATSGISLVCFVDKQQGREVVNSLKRNLTAFKDMKRPPTATVLEIPSSLNLEESSDTEKPVNPGSRNHPDESSKLQVETHEKLQLLHERQKIQREMLSKQQDEEFMALIQEL